MKLTSQTAKLGARSLTAASLLALASLAGTAAAANIDGIMTGSDGYTGSKNVQWYNNHHSIYTMAAGLTTKLHYAYDSGTLSLLVQVPIYAKNMIWAEDKSDLDPVFVQYYEDGTHHSSWNSSYKTAVDSEYFKLEGTGTLAEFDNDMCFGLASDGGNCDVSPFKNPVPGGIPVSKDSPVSIYWQTSLDWLLGAGSAECGDITGSGSNDPSKNCGAYNRTMSLEIAISGLLSEAEGQAIVDSVTAMNLHLSDEMIAPVPVPAAAWLFGSALLGLVAVGRRRA